jgi:hypothetical protein
MINLEWYFKNNNEKTSVKLSTELINIIVKNVK